MKIISEKYVGITMESGGMLEGGRVRLGIVEKIGSKRETHWLQPSEIVAIDIKSESRERGLDWYTLEIVPAEGKGVEPVTVKASIHEFKKLKGIKESTGQSGIDENGSSGGPIALWKQMGILPRIGLVLFGVVFAGLYIVADIQESIADPTPRPTQRATREPRSEFTAGMAIVRCQEEVENLLNANVDFEGTVRITLNERLEELPNNRFKIKSWYDMGDGVERRYTCVISFLSGPEDFGIVVSDGW